jgi:hypothetical protein
MPRDPLPVQLETGAMPANNCLWLHENQCSLPTRPEPSQHHPEQLVSNPKPGLWMPPFQRSELLPEGEIFEEQVAAKTAGSSSQKQTGATAGGAWSEFDMEDPAKPDTPPSV